MRESSRDKDRYGDKLPIAGERKRADLNRFLKRVAILLALNSNFTDGRHFTVRGF